MSLIKAAGLIITFSVAVAAGLAAGESYRREICRLRGFLRLVGFIRTQIGEFHAPLGEIYRKFGDSTPEISDFLKAMREKGFEGAVCHGSEKLNLSDRTCSILRDFAEGLGKSDAADQVKRCAVCENGLAEELKRVEEALPGKLKVCRALSVAFGVMTVILLI